MGRILAIDYGLKRTGIAVTDPLQIIANGIATVETSKLFEFLGTYLKQETVDRIVMGFPRQMNNQPSESMTYIQKFVKEFQRIYPQIPVVYVDERFTSMLAVRAMVEGGVKKKDRRDKALIDKVSAVIILQSYLESLQFKK